MTETTPYGDTVIISEGARHRPWVLAARPQRAALPTPQHRQWASALQAEPEGDTENILVYGSPGVGKTAVIRAALDPPRDPQHQARALGTADSQSADSGQAWLDDFESASEADTDPSHGAADGLRAAAVTSSGPRSGQVWTLDASLIRDATTSTLADTPPFRSAAGFTETGCSKRKMFVETVKGVASPNPLDDTTPTVVITRCDALQDDIQMALRRVIEDYGNAQFILEARQPTALIGPLRSRCLPAALPQPTTDQLGTVLDRIAAMTDTQLPEATREALADAVDGNLRQAINAFQLLVLRDGPVSAGRADTVVTELQQPTPIADVFDAVADHDFDTAQALCADLLESRPLDTLVHLAVTYALSDDTPSITRRDVVRTVPPMAAQEGHMQSHGAGADTAASVRLLSLITELVESRFR